MPSVVSAQSHELAASFAGLLGRQLRGSVVTDDYFRADHSALWAVIAGGGWLDLAVPEADGGGGLTLPDLTAVAEAWGRHIIPLPLTPALVLRGIPAVRAAAAPADILTTAVPGGGVQLVPRPGCGPARYVSWPVPEGRPGGDPVLTCLPAGLADDFAPSLPLGVASESSGIPGQEALARLAVLWAAEAVGAAAAAFRVAFDYAGVRVAFGRRIAEFQAVKHRVADMYERLELARTAVLWAANTAPAGHQRGVRLAVTLAREVAEGAIQVMGGMGFTWEAGIHFYLRHILAVGRLTEPAGVAATAAGGGRAA
jgi:alkylation response protein AidB-like acyl-CoA dehydrogenase